MQTTIDWMRAQAALGVKPDGRPGPATYAALLVRVAGHAVPLASALGAALASSVAAYEVDASADRLGAFLGQTAHESRGFTGLREVWGPSEAQRGYQGRMGNVRPGDGERYLGRGLIQLTGRSNYARFGQLLGLPLEATPEIAARPEIAVATALAYWRERGLNALADRADWRGLTRAINGGLNGYVERVELIRRAFAVLRASAPAAGAAA